MRLLKTEEAALIEVLLMTNPQIASTILPTINTMLVENMDDGEMGSLLFQSFDNNSNRSFGKILAEAEFLDKDKVPVYVQLNLDNHSQLFELDIWKVDYSPVSRLPNLDQIVIKEMI
jgi:hypothetical protein